MLATANRSRVRIRLGKMVPRGPLSRSGTRWTLQNVTIHLPCVSQMVGFITRATRSIARYLLWKDGWLSICHASVLSKRLNLS